MQPLILSSLDLSDDAVEIVERKGLGHPDTICDALAENLSRELCSEYRQRFGRILHHNVDKALLCGGRADPAFGGGEVLAPIDIYLAGRAATEFGGNDIRIEEIAVEGARSWLRANLHALDIDRHVRLHALIRPGSHDLQDLFSRHDRSNVPLANDTSIGVGYAPLSPLETLVLAVEQSLNRRNRSLDHPAWGEDIKVMGVRNGRKVRLTVACAMIGRHLRHIDDYRGEKAEVERRVLALAAQHGFPTCDVGVNTADDPVRGDVYLTVTGTSAEAGDDGQVGRGNRINGLITPCRPMSLEAAAGKNPVTHVGKIYNVLARRIAEGLIAEVPEIAAAHCLMVSRIGAPITTPELMQVKLGMQDGSPVDRYRHRAADIVAACLAQTEQLSQEIAAGTIGVF